MEPKPGKIVKSLEFFLFFQSYNNQCLISEKVFVLVKSYSIWPVCLQPIMKKVLFLSFLRSLLTTDLSDNLESGKRNYCLGKRSGKSIEFIFWYMVKVRTVVEKRISSGFYKDTRATFIRKDNFLTLYLLISQLE